MYQNHIIRNNLLCPTLNVIPEQRNFRFTWPTKTTMRMGMSSRILGVLGYRYMYGLGYRLGCLGVLVN